MKSLISGFLRLDKVKAAWKYVVSWTMVFKGAEGYSAESNSVNTYELKQLFKKIGFVLDSVTLMCLTRRYGGREGKISEDDFLQAFCRVLALYQTFKKKSSDGKITQTLSEVTAHMKVLSLAIGSPGKRVLEVLIKWLSSALYL